VLGERQTLVRLTAVELRTSMASSNNEGWEPRWQGRTRSEFSALGLLPAVSAAS